MSLLFFTNTFNIFRTVLSLREIISTDNPQPTTHNPQPTTHNPQLKTHNSKLIIHNS